MRLPNRLRAFRPGKTWIVLGASIGIGLLAALGARSYLNGRMAEMDADARGRKINVVVAKRDLSKGTRLSTDIVAVRSIPQDYAHASAILPQQFDRVEGQPLAYDVKGGEEIVWSLLEPKRPPTFSAHVESGRRAMTVAVDEINSISGMLEPGDLIDLMLTVDQKGKKVTVPFMQGVHVMATGTRAVDDPKTGERKTYSTVTLDADPTQARNIIVARDAGRITALLRNPQDKADARFNNLNLADLLGNGLSASAREIPVLYGGTNKLSPEALNLPQRPAQVSVPASP